jgi:hypothetical protein
MLGEILSSFFLKRGGWGGRGQWGKEINDRKDKRTVGLANIN